MEFKRKAVVQALDTFPSKADLSAVDAFIREQGRKFGVSGDLVVTYAGNGGRTSIVFKNRPKVSAGEIEEDTKVS
jgi:hypothetical protein